MPLDFPSNPIDGQIYDNYYWDSAAGVWNSLGNYAIPNLLSNATFTSSGSSVVPVTVKGAASQAANLQEWKNNSNTTLASISASGGLTLNNALTVGNGGTGATSLTSGAYLKGNGSNAIQAQSGIPAGDITSGSLAVARGGTGFSTGAGLVPMVPTSIVVSSGSASVNAFGKITMSSAVNVAVNGVFSSAFRNYKIIFNYYTTAVNWTTYRLRSNGVDNANANSYDTQYMYQSTTVNPSPTRLPNETAGRWFPHGHFKTTWEVTIYSPAEPLYTVSLSHGGYVTNTNFVEFGTMHSVHKENSTFDGFHFINTEGKTGSIQVFGIAE